MCSRLEADVKEVRKQFGDDAIIVRCVLTTRFTIPFKLISTHD
jgi:hypothetical protein